MEAGSDPHRDGRERSTYTRLIELLSSREFVQNLAMMYDALEELSELSLCEKSGPHLTIVDEVLYNKNAAVFKGVPLQLANAATC